jgi:hypothetical protein
MTTNFQLVLESMKEAEVARQAIRLRRREVLISEIESLVGRIEDCDQLIAEGKVDHRYTLDVMVKPQLQRIKQAMDRYVALYVASAPAPNSPPSDETSQE